MDNSFEEIRFMGIWSDEIEQIELLIKQVYKWHETDNSKYGMLPLANKDGDNYIGFDLENHKLRLNELRETNFFSDEFLNNYNRIVLTLDNKLRTKEFEWSAR